MGVLFGKSVLDTVFLVGQPIGSAGIHPGFVARHPFKSPFASISQIAEGQLFEIWEYYLIFRRGWVGGWLLSAYEYKKLSTGRPGNMPRSALLCLKIKIWAVTGNLGLEIECSG